MKIIAFGVREDEKTVFLAHKKQSDFTLTTLPQHLSHANVHLAQGYDGVSVLASCDVSESILVILQSYHIKVVASRSTGYDNIDVAAATRCGIVVSNSTYSPYSVAEFSLMFMLMLNRKVVAGMQRAQRYDFSLAQLQGRELKYQTVGIIGTGKIGAALAKCLSGCAGTILAYDVIENPTLEGIVHYCDLETLLATSDIISLHTPLMASTKHFINANTIVMMKAGVIIINTSRGELIDTAALIDGLQRGHVGGAALDVLEHERGIYHCDRRENPCVWPFYEALQSMDNVLLTQHFAFYTTKAVEDMVTCSVMSILATVLNHTNPYRLN